MNTCSSLIHTLIIIEEIPPRHTRRQRKENTIMKKVLLTPDNAEQYASYLRDESRLCGCAAELAFPSDPEELSEYLRKEYDAGHPVVIQGARTGVSGGAMHHHGTGKVRVKLMHEEHGSSYPLMVGLKHMMDPNGIMNPGTLILQE